MTSNIVDFRRAASQLVEVIINSTTAQFVFPDVPQLRNDASQIITIKAIELITAKTLGKGPSGTTIGGVSELQKGTLILYSQGWNKVYQLPLLLLNGVNDAGTNPFNQNIQIFDDLKAVDWNKSFINFFSAPTPTYSILLNVSYQRATVDPSTGKIISVQ